jgi:hypothetical protein
MTDVLEVVGTYSSLLFNFLRAARFRSVYFNYLWATRGKKTCPVTGANLPEADCLSLSGVPDSANTGPASGP